MSDAVLWSKGASRKETESCPAEVRMKKLAAFKLCFIGQADRSPEAISNTLSHMQQLPVAPGNSLEAVRLAGTLVHSEAEDGRILNAPDSFAYMSTPRELQRPHKVDSAACIHVQHPVQ